jgi:hypothetical protein
VSEGKNTTLLNDGSDIFAPKSLISHAAMRRVDGFDSLGVAINEFHAYVQLSMKKPANTAQRLIRPFEFTQQLSLFLNVAPVPDVPHKATTENRP